MTVSSNDKLSTSIKKSESAPSVQEQRRRKLQGQRAAFCHPQTRLYPSLLALLPAAEGTEELEFPEQFQHPWRREAEPPFLRPFVPISSGTASLVSAWAVHTAVQWARTHSKASAGKEKNRYGLQFPGLVHRVPAWAVVLARGRGVRNCVQGRKCHRGIASWW